MKMTENDIIGQLSEKQIAAIPHILFGRTDEQVANEIGVTRQTVNVWRNQDPNFIAELNLRRHAIWECNVDKLRLLAMKALVIIEDDLENDDEKVRRKAAYFFANQMSFKKFLEPKGDTNPKKIQLDLIFDELM
jgi:hypothetical protein